MALWDTARDGLSVARDTPAGRGLLAGYADALRRHGLRVGLYHSHSDWSHPDYPTVRHPAPEPGQVAVNGNRFSTPSRARRTPPPGAVSSPTATPRSRS